VSSLSGPSEKHAGWLPQERIDSNPRLWGKGFLTHAQYVAGLMVEASQWYFRHLDWEQLPGPPRRRLRRTEDPESPRGRHVVLAMVFLSSRDVRVSSADIDAGLWANRAARHRPSLYFSTCSRRLHGVVIGQYFLGFEVMRRRLVNLFLQVSLLIVAIESRPRLRSSRRIRRHRVSSRTLGPGASRCSRPCSCPRPSRSWSARSSANKDPIVRKQAILMSAGVVIHGTGAESYAYLRSRDLYPPSVSDDYRLRDGGPLRGRVLRYRMFVVTPKKRNRSGCAAFRPEGATRTRFGTEAAAGVHRGRRSGRTGGAGPRDHAPHADRGPRRLSDSRPPRSVAHVGRRPEPHPPTNPGCSNASVREFVSAQPKPSSCSKGSRSVELFGGGAVVRLLNTDSGSRDRGDGVLLAEHGSGRSR